jgi:hypothetical protein
VNSGVGDVEIWVLDVCLRLKALGVARESQENILGMNDAQMPRTEAAESIQQVATPERPPSALSIPSAIQSIWIGLEEMIIALLNL